MTQRNRQTENLIEDILGKDNAKFFLEASQYLRNLNFSAMDNYPPTDVYFKYEGDSEGTQEDRNNPTNYSFHVKLALSGFNKDEISVEINEETKSLKITAEKAEKEEEKNEDIKYLRQQIANRRIVRTVSIPFTHGIKDHSASYEDGILHISISPEFKNMIHKVNIS